MHELNIVSRSYEVCEYLVDLVISTDEKGNVLTDVWLGHKKGNIKIFIFSLFNKDLTEALRYIASELTSDKTYTTALDRAEARSNIINE